MTSVRRVLLARVCGVCGHVEFYIKDPAELVEIAARARDLDEKKSR
jgi:hypothetical protein